MLILLNVKFFNDINSLLSFKDNLDLLNFSRINFWKEVFLNYFIVPGYNCRQVFLSGKVLFGESELGFDDDDDDDDDGFDDVSDSLQKFEPNFPPATEQNRFVIKHTKDRKQSSE